MPLPFDVDVTDGLPNSTMPRSALWTSTRIGILPGTALFFAWDARVAPPVAIWDMPVEQDAAVYEVMAAEDWSRLCADHPRDTTDRRRESWAEDLGVHDRRIITPAWESVGERWDAVHLTVAGLLTTTGRIIPIDGGVTSVLRWHTETTAWFRPAFERPVLTGDWTADLPYTG